MTVAIAIVLPDSALLITDGRRSVVGSGHITGDQHEKIFPFPASGCQLAIFGVTAATDAAVQLFGLGQPCLDGVAVHLRAKASVEHGWAQFCASRSDIPFGLPGIKAGLLVTGIDRFGPYLSASKIDGPSQSEHLHVGPFYEAGAHVTLGFSAEIDQRFQQRLHESGWLLSSSLEPSDRARRIAQLAAEEIRAEARINPTVGGAIRYRAMPSVGPVYAGAL